MKKQRRNLWTLIVAFVLISLACNMPTKTPTPSATVTPGEATPATPGMTVTAGTATPGVGTLTPSAGTPTLTPTEAPAVEGEGGCTLRAAYVADVTIPDNTSVAKGAAFVKTWRLRNTGTCPWAEGTKFTYVSGETLGAPVAVVVPATAPTAQVDISVPMIAPATPGTYRSNWQLQDPQGKPFGGIFYVQIIVEGTPTPTFTVTPGVAPSNLVGQVAADCKSVTFTWTGAKGETAYRIEGPGLSMNLPADIETYVWNNPPAGSSLVTLIAFGQNAVELGRVSTTVNVTCNVSGVDLYVESLAFAPSPPVAFLPLKVTVRVRNQGTVASGNFTVRWWGGKDFPSASCEWNVSSVAPGTTTVLGCDNFAYHSAYSTIVTKISVDVENLVAESNETNNVFETNIPVTSPQTVYDFVNKAPLAGWQSGDPVTALGWDGAAGDAQGFVRYASGQLETGGTIQGQCLETYPKWVAHGWVVGYYTDLYNSLHYKVQPGDLFYATVGLLKDANAGNVTFKVILRASSSGEVTIAQVNDTYGDGLKTINVDLSPYAGQNADMVLEVDAGDSADQDWACWLQAAIFRYP
ncbi:MAG TPA: NBR1-Ig-like domain-containing protein [Anaerolineae bacterium]|nr:NBR1-Ig-like domain-containing protein [Anaerolineae bacterium]HQH39209.1 NBR1-Ig-like domain-containing protein [Anaerolineae bacterium]